MSDLRLHTFCSFYLSSIQQGIQSAHVTSELFVKYKYNFDLSSRLYDWAENHKTMIVLNGGINKSLHDLSNFLKEEKDNLSFPAPFATFNEDEASLGGILTTVGIVLPEEIYDAVNYSKAQSLVESGSLDQRVSYQPWTHESNAETISVTAAACEIIDISKNFFFIKDGKIEKYYVKDTADWRFLSILKSCPLAR